MNNILIDSCEMEETIKIDWNWNNKDNFTYEILFNNNRWNDRIGSSNRDGWSRNTGQFLSTFYPFDWGSPTTIVSETTLTYPALIKFSNSFAWYFPNDSIPPGDYYFMGGNDPWLKDTQNQYIARYFY